MTTFFVGQVDEVRPTSRKDKNTGQVQMSTTLTATFETVDNEGYLNKSTENIQFPIDLLGSLQSTKGKYIAIPYMYLTTAKGNYLFPDDNLKFSIFDKNPFEVKK
jgi:hypothetical protein